MACDVSPVAMFLPCRSNAHTNPSNVRACALDAHLCCAVLACQMNGGVGHAAFKPKKARKTKSRG